MNKIYFLFTLIGQVSYIFTWGATGKQLKKDPILFSKINKVVNGLDNLTNGWSNSFVEAAPWADDLKYNGYTFLNVWHYVDWFIDPENPPVQPYPDDDFQSNDVEINILYGMNQCEKVIRNSQQGFTISMENSMMARFIVHLVGDAHQPQHCSALKDADYPTGDAGGNLYKINGTIKTYDGTIKNVTNGNLHSLWDSALYQIPYIYRPLNESSKQYIEQIAQNLTQKYSRYYFGERLTRSRTGWTREGQYLAWKYAYEPLLKSDNPHLVTQEYVDNGWEICQQLFTIAGYRLADTLTYFFTHPYNEDEVTK